MIYQLYAISDLKNIVQGKIGPAKRQNVRNVLLTYVGSHVFQLFSGIHLSNK